MDCNSIAISTQFDKWRTSCLKQSQCFCWTSITWVLPICNSHSILYLTQHRNSSIYCVFGTLAHPSWIHLECYTSCSHSVRRKDAVHLYNLSSSTSTSNPQIVLKHEQLQTDPIVFSLYSAWSLGELMRYPYYTLNELGIAPPILTWLRYSGFLVLQLPKFSWWIVVGFWVNSILNSNSASTSFNSLMLIEFCWNPAHILEWFNATEFTTDGFVINL